MLEMIRKQKRIALNVDRVLSNHYVERVTLSSPANYKSANLIPTCQFVLQINVISRQALMTEAWMYGINLGICLIKKFKMMKVL